MSIQPNVWGITKDVKNIENEDKDEYKPDKRITRIYEAKRAYEKKERQKNFQRWLHEYNEKNIQIKQIITHLCNDTFSMIRTNGFTISNEKILRDEIATFIYKEASDHA